MGPFVYQGRSARGNAQHQWVCISFALHEWQTCLCTLRVTGSLLPNHGWKARLEA